MAKKTKLKSTHMSFSLAPISSVFLRRFEWRDKRENGKLFVLNNYWHIKPHLFRLFPPFSRCIHFSNWRMCFRSDVESIEATRTSNSKKQLSNILTCAIDASHNCSERAPHVDVSIGNISCLAATSIKHAFINRETN